MNKILQKRIIDKTNAIVNFNLVDLNDLVNQHDLFKMLIEIAAFTLQNQWISVEEALPPEDNDSKYTKHSACVFVRLNHFGQISYATLVYLYDKNKWSVYDGHVTHWMSIPSLEESKK